MDKETEKVFIQDVKNRFNALSPCEISEKRFLNNCLLIIEQKEKKIAMLEAKLEAETAVKDRFKELYVSVVVGKALKDEGVEV